VLSADDVDKRLLKALHIAAEKHPATQEAEDDLLALCVQHGPRALAAAVLDTGLDAGDFSRAPHRAAFAAMAKRHTEGVEWDSTTVLADTAGRVTADQMADWLHRHTERKLSTEYARIVVEGSQARRAWAVCWSCMDTLACRDAPAAEAATEAIASLAAVLERRARSRYDRDAAFEAVLTDGLSGRRPGLSTGWPGLDRLLEDALCPGHLVIIAARPGMGKTAIGVQLAAHVAQSGLRVGFLSLEEGPEALIRRAIIQRSGVPRWAWPNSEAAVRRATADVHALPVEFEDVGGASILELGEHAHRLVREGASLLVVDYVGLIRGTGAYKGNRTAEVGEVSRGLKGLASKLSVPVVALAQLNRGVEGRADKRPNLADLRDSGEIEQDAHAVMFPYRPGYQRRDNEDDPGAELIVAKNRSGPVGVVKVAWRAQAARYDSIEQRSQAPELDSAGRRIA
jgi:replicative DNA helicase